MQSSGWPDLNIMSPHYHGWLELKVDARQLEPLQKKRMHEIRKRKVPAWVLRCVNADRMLRFEDHERKIVGKLSLDDWGVRDDVRGRTLIERLRDLEA